MIALALASQMTALPLNSPSQISKHADSVIDTLRRMPTSAR